MSDFWAYCEPCGRWFYPEAVNGSVGRTPPCPVCSTEAVTLAEQPGDVPEASSSASA